MSPAGSHKPNTAVPQAFYNAQAGIRRLATETGAGQWGSALALAGRLFGIAVRVYMVRVSYEQKPFRRSLIETWGAEVIASPSRVTQAGRNVLGARSRIAGLARHRDLRGRRGGRFARRYQLRARLRAEPRAAAPDRDRPRSQDASSRRSGEYPDAVFASCGGGSNFGGIAFPFFADKATGGSSASSPSSPTSCPTLTRGSYAYDFGDTAGLTPLMLMYTLGHDFVPPRIHAGGLRYHADSPLVSQLVHEGLVEAKAVPQLATFEAGVTFARTEGIVPAPESSHAIRAVIDEALACKERKEPRVLLFNLSGHGHFDMAAYDQYFRGELEDFDYPAEAIAASLEKLPKVASG